jgi:hypothetical protein
MKIINLFTLIGLLFFSACSPVIAAEDFTSEELAARVAALETRVELLEDQLHRLTPPADLDGDWQIPEALLYYPGHGSGVCPITLRIQDDEIVTASAVCASTTEIAGTYMFDQLELGLSRFGNAMVLKPRIRKTEGPTTELRSGPLVFDGGDFAVLEGGHLEIWESTE